VKKHKIKVLGSNILIKKNNQQKFGNLLIPENNQDSFYRGIVCGLGEGKKDSTGNNIEFTVNIDDEVIFPKSKGYEIKFDENNYVILKEEEIIGIILN
jgi:chaperonin GroES